LPSLPRPRLLPGVSTYRTVQKCEATSLHGESRLIRNGIQIGKYLITSACRHCNDPKCMNSCPTGAIKRRPGGEIYFDYDQCIGCGNCAIACPFDNIAMIDTPSFDSAQAPQERSGEEEVFSPLSRRRSRCSRRSLVEAVAFVAA
jgi:Fe-S-cluster-containing dehydrogenase component